MTHISPLMGEGVLPQKSSAGPPLSQKNNVTIGTEDLRVILRKVQTWKNHFKPNLFPPFHDA